MLEFDLPIMYRTEHYWISGKMPSTYQEKPLKQIMRKMQFCHDGVDKLFDVPDDAFMLQFVISSERMPNSYECVIEDDRIVNVGEVMYVDWVIIDIIRAILNHSDCIHTWYLQCFYWVVE